MKYKRSFNNKEMIEKIIPELKRIEKDQDIEINFTPNVVEEAWYDFNGESYVILKNVIEIKSKRFMKVDDIYESSNI